MTDRHPVFELSDRFVDQVAALCPMLATSLGVPGHDAEWDDTSPEGVAAVAAFLGQQRAALDAASRRTDGPRWPSGSWASTSSARSSRSSTSITNATSATSKGCSRSCGRRSRS